VGGIACNLVFELKQETERWIKTARREPGPFSLLHKGKNMLEKLQRVLLSHGRKFWMTCPYKGLEHTWANPILRRLGFGEEKKKRGKKN